jgi:hypothetical protein
MLSKKECERVMIQEFGRIIEELADETRNGEATYSAQRAIKHGALYLVDNPQLQRVEFQAAYYYRKFEKLRTPRTSRRNAQGQLEFKFLYAPSGLIKYSKDERGLMRDMTALGALRRSRLLQEALKNTTDGITAELIAINGWLQAWDRTQFKTLDELQRAVFGYEDQPEQEPPDDEENDEENDDA